MGGHIAGGFLQALSSENQTQAPEVPSRRKRAVKTTDNMVFEEETGNPGRLSEGYVVVRKKDLW